jgi:DNA-binding transcriptional LysR family regulator
MEKHLVKIAGRAEVPGRPILYGTTRRFLEVFGLNSTKDLPQPENGKSSLPLVVPPDGSTERTAATTALDGHDRIWHVSYSSTSTLGLQPAVAAGLGVAAMPRSAVENGNGHGTPGGTRVLGSESGLPQLPDIDVKLHRVDGAGVAAQRFGDFITAALIGNDPH